MIIAKCIKCDAKDLKEGTGKAPEGTARPKSLGIIFEV